jgi:hypothetical protein
MKDVLRRLAAIVWDGATQNPRDVQVARRSILTEEV